MLCPLFVPLFGAVLLRCQKVQLLFAFRQSLPTRPHSLNNNILSGTKTYFILSGVYYSRIAALFCVGCLATASRLKRACLNGHLFCRERYALTRRHTVNSESPSGAGWNRTIVFCQPERSTQGAPVSPVILNLLILHHRPTSSALP